MIDKLQSGEWKEVPKRNDLPKLPEEIQQRLTAIVESSQKRQLLSTSDNGDKIEEIDHGDKAEEIQNEDKTGDQLNPAADQSVGNWNQNGHGKGQKKKNKRAKANSKKGVSKSTNQDG